MTYKKIQPRNYLYCDGSTFNASQYPALYLYLGSNVLPDFQQEPNYVYIKAVDGVDISDEDTFLDTVKNFVEEKNSYSTTEMLTGGKWIDGKPIYRMSFSATGISSSAVTLSTALNNTTITPVKVFGFATNKADGNFLQLGYTGGVSVLITSSELRLVGNYTYSAYNITIEYTKTTD